MSNGGTGTYGAAKLKVNRVTANGIGLQHSACSRRFSTNAVACTYGIGKMLGMSL
jgi:hypothetical protein